MNYKAYLILHLKISEDKLSAIPRMIDIYSESPSHLTRIDGNETLALIAKISDKSYSCAKNQMIRLIASDLLYNGPRSEFVWMTKLMHHYLMEEINSILEDMSSQAMYSLQS